MSEVIYDIESYWNVFLVGIKRIEDGKTVIMEQSDREQIDLDYLKRILLRNTMIGYNSMNYDAPVLWKFIETGGDVGAAKVATNQIIGGGVKWWDAEDTVGVRIPWDFKSKHIDLMEPQPNPFASLKILHARMHGHRLRDLPYDPEMRLSFDQIDQLRDYLEHSDLPATEKLWHALAEPMELRRDISARIGQNVMSKSDTQMGLAIVKKRAEDLLGRKIDKPRRIGGQVFRYRVPDYIRFESPVMRGIIDRLREHDFIVNAKGKVDLPEWLHEPFKLGTSTYSMGIGGLHSTESNRAVRADADHTLVDFDVASYYPAIILTLGLYPESVGPRFLEVYEGIRADRLAAKKRAKQLKSEIAAIEARIAELTSAEASQVENV